MGIDIHYKIVPTFIAMFFLLLSNALAGQHLTIKIQNKTGYKIDSLTLATKYIGSIEKDSTSGPIQFEQFGFDSGYPYESISGHVGKKLLKNIWWSWCGTEREVIKKGEFLFVLNIRQEGDDEYLFLR